MELELMMTLGWMLNPPTIHSNVHHLVALVDSDAAPQDHPLLTGENDSENEHAPSPTDVFATEAYEGSPKKKQRVA